jgi:hypothetical protein
VVIVTDGVVAAVATGIAVVHPELLYSVTVAASLTARVTLGVWVVPLVPGDMDVKVGLAGAVVSITMAF